MGCIVSWKCKTSAFHATVQYTENEKVQKTVFQLKMNKKGTSSDKFVNFAKMAELQGVLGFGIA